MSAQTTPLRVVLIDDEAAFGLAVKKGMTTADLEVQTFADPVEGMMAALEPGIDVILLDLNLPNVSGLALLRELKQKQPDAEVVIMTGFGSIQTAMEAVRAGAYDYLTKPFERLEEVINVVHHAGERKRLLDRNRELERLVTSASPSESFIGESSKMRQVFQLIDQVSYSTSTVLIQGESGTGKELVARSIHAKSPRGTRPFIALNCAALTETLLESELFGHAKGAFTGAANAKRGLFEAANGGTLFLDEIGDMPLTTQVRLLRVLQEGEVRPVGSTETVKVEVRVIAATHVDLQKAIQGGRFREDLFYRINVINLRLPALRERPTDVPLLAHHFLRVYAKKLGKRVERISPDAMQALVTNGWPGNVREMENLMERAVVLTRGDEVGLGDLPAEFGRQRGGAEEDISSLSHMPYPQAKRLAVGAFDRRYLATLLRRTRGNISAASAIAGMDRSNFRRMLKQYQLISAREENSSGAVVETDRPDAN